MYLAVGIRSDIIGRRMETQRKKDTVKLSKKRFGEMERMLRETIVDEGTIGRVLEVVCKVLDYDPKQGQYSKDQLMQLVERRRAEASAKGVSQYELTGRREYYQKNKAVLNRKKLEYYHANKGVANAAPDETGCAEGRVRTTLI